MHEFITKDMERSLKLKGLEIVPIAPGNVLTGDFIVDPDCNVYRLATQPMQAGNPYVLEGVHPDPGVVYEAVFMTDPVIACAFGIRPIGQRQEVAAQEHELQRLDHSTLGAVPNGGGVSVPATVPQEPPQDEGSGWKAFGLITGAVIAINVIPKLLGW